MIRPLLVAVIAASTALSGCAQNPDKIAASYVSPSTYDGRSCSQLLAERNEIASKVNSLSAEQKEAATTDAVLTGVALVIFWPAAIGLASTKDNEAALSSAKGNYDAITTKMTQKNCRIPTTA